MLPIFCSTSMYINYVSYLFCNKSFQMDCNLYFWSGLKEFCSVAPLTWCICSKVYLLNDRESHLHFIVTSAPQVNLPTEWILEILTFNQLSSYPDTPHLYITNVCWLYKHIRSDNNVNNNTILKFNNNCTVYLRIIVVSYCICRWNISGEVCLTRNGK